MKYPANYFFKLLFIIVTLNFSVLLCKRKDVSFKNSIKEGKYKVVGDILVPVLPSGFESAGIPFLESRWPNHIIPYVIDSEYKTEERDIILGAMNEIMAATCIKFLERGEEINYIRIESLSPNECRAVVGREGLSFGQPVFIGTNCLTHKNVLHELVHAIGFYHEHNRKDRDQYVTIFWNNIVPSYKVNFQKHDTNDFGVPYDYGSIMHYTEFDGSGISGMRSMESKPPGKPLGYAQRLSEFDKLKINRMYNCDTTPLSMSSSNFEKSTTTTMPLPTATPKYLFYFQTTTPYPYIFLRPSNPPPSPSSYSPFQPPSTFCRNGRVLGPKITITRQDCCYKSTNYDYTCSIDTTYWKGFGWDASYGPSKFCPGVNCS